MNRSTELLRIGNFLVSIIIGWTASKELYGIAGVLLVAVIMIMIGINLKK